MTKINNILSYILLAVIITIVAHYYVKADETVSDTLRFNNKEIVRTYSSDTIFVNSNLYDDIDKEDIKLDPDVFVPCDKNLELDMDELANIVQYPTKALNSGVSGVVYVKCLIGRNSKLLKTFVDYSENDILNQAALDAVVKVTSWVPAANHGKNVALWISIPIEFRMKSK